MTPAAKQVEFLKQLYRTEGKAMQLATTNGGAMVTAEHAAAIRTALKSSLYPGASDNSVDMVLAYCKATGLDPMTKPVHIVPMYDKNSKGMRDVVMPGIGKYRIDAARTGRHAGTSDPEFGPIVEMILGGTKMRVPEWCRVVVFKMMDGGHIAEYSGRELWVENYATAGRDTDAPNAMWKKRPFGQIAKCAEAQALRKAFPEQCNAPTAEEMEGCEIEGAAAAAPVVTMPQRKASPKAETIHDAEVIDTETGEVTTEAKPEPLAEAKAAGGELSAMPAGMRRSIEAKLVAAGLDVAALAAAHPGIGTDAATAGPDANKAFAWIKAQQS